MSLGRGAVSMGVVLVEASMRSHCVLGWRRSGFVLAVMIAFASGPFVAAQDTRATPTYKRFKQKLDAIPAIDTHDHLFPFDRLPCIEETKRGRGVNLAGLWHNSYYRRFNPLAPWKAGMDFEDWWKDARHDFQDARATSFYRYQLPAFQDLYGVDFDRITDEQARDLDRRIFDNYKDQRWLYQVVTERANIELMFNDPYWARYAFATSYPWEVLVFNVTPLTHGFHASEFTQPLDSPYEFAKKHGLPVDSLNDYLRVLERMFLEAKDHGAVCLKTTLAYQRTLSFDNVPPERAEKAFGKRAAALSTDDIKAFEDFIMWRLCELGAKYELPFQIHTGDARIQGSNPMLLVDMIQANPKTRFILFHGGYPWIGETGAIVMHHASHVWIDSCWLPTISYTTAKRAFHEWLEVMPSNRIMWGADCNHAEGIYGATEFTRRCLAEVLAEKVDRGDLLEAHAERIGRQILRDNALELFPQLRPRLWKEKIKRLQPQ
jgi:uncharacterized protein